MPIKTSCSCGKLFNAPDSLLGKTVKCPGCQKPLKIVKSSTQTNAAILKVLCPHCQHGIKTPVSMSGKRIKCPQCENVVLVPEKPAEKNPHEFDIMESSKMEAEKRICPGCNAHVSEDDKLCVVCGTILSSGINIGRTERGMEDASVTEKISSSVIAVVIVIAVIAAGYYGYVEYFRKEIKDEVYSDTVVEKNGKTKKPKNSKQQSTTNVPANEPKNTVVTSIYKGFVNSSPAGTKIFSTEIDIDPFNKIRTYKAIVDRTLDKGFPLSIAPVSPIVFVKVLNENGKILLEEEQKKNRLSVQNINTIHHNKTIRFGITFQSKKVINNYKHFSGTIVTHVGYNPKRHDLGTIKFKAGQGSEKFDFKIDEIKVLNSKNTQVSMSLKSPVATTRVNLYDSNGDLLETKKMSVTGDEKFTQLNYIINKKQSFIKVEAFVYSKVEDKEISWEINNVDYSEKDGK